MTEVWNPMTKSFSSKEELERMQEEQERAEFEARRSAEREKQVSDEVIRELGRRTLESLSDEEYSDLLDRVNSGDFAAQQELEAMQRAKLNTEKAQESYDNFKAAGERAEAAHEILSGDAKPDEAVEVVDVLDVADVNGDKVDEIDKIDRLDEVENLDEISDAEIENIGQKLAEEAEKITAAAVEEETGNQVSEERKGRVRELLKKKVGKILARIAVVTFVAASLLTGFGVNHLMNHRDINNEIRVEQNQEDDGEKADEGDEQGDKKIEDGIEQGETEQRKNEKVSSTATFDVYGDSFTYENMMHEGGYDQDKDAYFDTNKTGKNAMTGVNYTGEWKKTSSSKEAYENMMENLKDTAGVATQMDGVLGITGNIKTLREQNDLATTLRAGDKESFDAYGTEISDYINEFADGGLMKVKTIKAGTEYMSTYSLQSKSQEGTINTYFDMSVIQDHDVHAIDLKNKDGKSLLNNEAVHNRVKDIYGIASDTNIWVGWSAECGQIIVLTETSSIDKDKPIPEEEGDDWDDDKPKPTPEEEDDDDKPTPEEEDDDDKPTPEEEDDDDKPTPEEEDDDDKPTPEEEETPENEKTPKGPDAHAGDEVQLGDTPEVEEGRTKVEGDGVGNTAEIARNPGEQVNDADTSAFNEVNAEKIEQDKATSTEENTQTQFSEDTSGYKEGEVNAVTGNVDQPTSTAEENLANQGSVNDQTIEQIKEQTANQTEEEVNQAGANAFAGIMNEMNNNGGNQ